MATRGLTESIQMLHCTGDAIITPQGEIFIIDINDFPSFSAIRDIAAKEIATLIMNKTK